MSLINIDERLVSSRIKERYHMIRGHKRKAFIHNVSTHSARIGVHLGEYDMIELQVQAVTIAAAGVMLL